MTEAILLITRALHKISDDLTCVAGYDSELFDMLEARQQSLLTCLESLEAPQLRFEDPDCSVWPRDSGGKMVKVGDLVISNSSITAEIINIYKHEQNNHYCAITSQGWIFLNRCKLCV